MTYSRLLYVPWITAYELLILNRIDILVLASKTDKNRNS